MRRRPSPVANLGPERLLTGDPAHVIGELFRRYSGGRARADLPPFAGGLVGTLGFEFIRYLEPVLDPVLHPGLTGFSDAGADAEFMLVDTLLAFDHAKDRALLIGTIFPRPRISRRWPRADREGVSSTP